jgi:transcriptional regulator with XRE-family HTH domain
MEQSEILRTVGLNLRAARLRAGLSQEELGLSSGLDRTYISGIERGVRNPTVVALAKVARGLDVSVSELVAEIP